MDLYREEKKQALKDGVLTKAFLALSREKEIPKVGNIHKKNEVGKIYVT